MWKSFVIFLPLTGAYYSETFFKNNCVNDYQLKDVYALKEALFCKNVFFTEEERTSISDEDFVLSDEEVIFFIDSDMGKVNHDFFSKFPLTRKMVFHNVTMSLTSSENISNDEDIVPLEILMILNSRILDNKDSNAFHSLRNLKNLEIHQSSFEFKTIDSNMIRNCVMLSLSNIELGDIDKAAFSKLPELISIELIGLNLTKFNKNLLRFNKKLQRLNLKNNLLPKIPTDLPESLLNLGLVKNRIERISRDDCKVLKNLKEFYLSYNLLSNIETDTFDDMTNLETLNLGSNRLINFDKRIISKLKSLRSLYVGGNLIADDEVSEMFLYAGYEQ